MKKKGILKERICALTLAFLMPFTSVLPHVTLVAVAEDVPVSTDVTFTVKDDTSAAIETAQVTIYEGDNEEALETKPADANGTVKFQLEDTTEYQFKVTKELYVPKERGLVSDVRVGNDVNITLSLMQDIQITPADAVVVENGKTTALTVANPVKDVEYTWATSDAKIATVDAATGVVTGVAKGRVDITVSGNGKTQTKTLVVKETPAMTVSVTPNKGPGQDDSVVTSVTLEAQLPADADGTVTFYHNSVNDPGNKLGSATVSGGKATLTVSESDSFQLIGTKEFWAEYSGSDITYYFGANVSTTGTYLKKHDLGLQETMVTKHYGDSVFKVPEVDANTVEDRDTTALAYDSDNKKVVTVNSTGELTIVGVGTANISVTIPESQNYTSSTAYYAVTVEKKDLGAVKLEKFRWQSVNKVYDGTDDIEIQGKLTNTEKPEVIGDDTILVKAKAKIEKADVEEYSSCKIGDVDITGNDNYSFTIDRADGDSVTLKDSNKIKVTQRPVYIQIEKKAGDFESTVSYGQSNTEIEKIIKDENQIVLAGTEGKINNDAQEGLLNGDVLNLAEHAEIILNSDTYYVNTTAYPNAIQPKVTKKDVGNYEICVKNDSQYYGRLLVTSEAKTDAQIKAMVDVNDDADGVYEEIGTDNIWVRGKGLETLRFSLKDSTFYKQIMVSADGGTNYVEFPSSNGQGLQFTDSTDADKTLNIYLKNKDGGEETRTKDGNTYLVKVDAENPTAAFTGIDAGLFSNPMQVKFEDFKNSDYQVTIEAADSGSGVASFETCIIQTANDASIMNDIIAAQSNTSIWNKHVDLKPATETINSEGNNLVLARIRDNVGNEAIYTSNGLVFETNKPKLTVVVNNGKPIGPVQDDSKVPYTISVTDMDQEISVSSGIDKIEVIVTDNGSQVGSSTALDADNKVVDSYTVSSEDIDKIIGTENDDKTTLSYLVKRASFAIDGLLSVNKYHTNKVTIQITAYDKAGNVTSETVENLCLDNVLPEVLVGYDKYDAKSMHYFDSREMTLKYTERNFSEDLLSFDVEVNGEKQTGTAEGSRLTMAELNTVTGSQMTKVSDTQGNVTNPDEYKDDRVITYKTKISEDGAYKIIPYVKDTAGNENEGVDYEEAHSESYDGNELFIIDRTKPVVNISYDTDVENGYYTARTMTIVFTERNFDESLLSFELEMNGEKQTGSAADSRLNLAELKGIKNLSVGTVSDSEAGIADENSHTAARTLTYTIEFKKDGCYKLIPHIEDKAKNTNEGVIYNNASSTSNETFYVDNTKPEIHAAYNDNEIGVKNERFFNKQRTMTITYKERNFSLERATFKLNIDGQEKVYTYETLKAALGETAVSDIVDNEKEVDEKKHTDAREIKFTITFGNDKEDHDYQIDPVIIDLAGNTNGRIQDTGSKVETNQKFTIDMVIPQISVSYDNDSASNDKYFNTDRTMTLTYHERNITQEGLVFDLKADKKEYNKITLMELRELSEETGIVISAGSDSQGDQTGYNADRTLTYTIKFTGGDNADMDYEIIPYIEDQASNKNQDKDGNPIINYTGTTANQIFTVDKTAPEMKVDYYLVDGSNLEKLNISTDEINRLYKNKTIRVIATVEERNFSLKDSFSKEYKQVIPHFTWKQDDGSAGSVAGFENTAVNSSKWTSEGIVRTQAFDFESDGDYSFSLEYTDLAGNKLKQQYPKHFFTVDKTAPEAEVVYEVNGKEVSPGEIEENRFYSNEEITATVTFTERNFAREDQASKFEKNQMNLTYTAENLDKKPITTENYTESADTRAKWTSEGYVRTQKFIFNVDANYKFALIYKDMAGNDVKYNTHYFTFDKTAPTGRITVKDKGFWEKLFEKVFFFIFTGDEQKASLDSADVTAGVKSMQYYKHIPDVESRNVFNGLTLEALGKIKDWTDGKEVSVEANQQAVIYEKIVDKAGNVTYINMEQGIIADNAKPQAPEIKITIADPSQGIYDKDVPFTIDVTDPTQGETYSGLKSVRYEVLNNGVITQSGDFNNQLTNPSARVKSIHEERIVYGAQNNSNHVTIKVYVEDYSGNQSEASRDLKIDMTDPEVQITYDLNNPSNGKYYNATRTATVSVRERNFDPDAVDFTITNTDGTMPSISGWSVSPVTGETDDAINTCVVTFAADGDYTITMNCRDRANRSSHYTQVDDFTIDQTVPVISAAFDNNSAANAGYYDKPRTATITVNEHNFNGSEVQAAISASLQSQGISAPGLNGWSTSGDTHTATIYFGTDGDYSFTINYTDLAGNAATAHTQEKFTVDQTKPQIDIFDIIDKSANNGTVAPGVKYSDVNYDAAGVKISIKGPKHSEETIAGSRTPIPNGESIKMADFEYKETVDDVYTLTAQVTDRAGNVDEKSVMFSVNRFGSNFIFGDSTKTFLDKYYSNKEQNLIITEINVDTLTHNGISYGLDGELVNLENGTDYTVKESGNEASWKSYQYTIKAENFEQEGLYNITIDSTDRAKNEVNNKVKEADIEFVIDKTKPTVVITGVENDGQYRTNNRDITINVADNVAMNRLDVSVDGTETKAESYDEKAILKQKGEIPFSLASSSNWQEITAIATDAAGNTADTTEIRVLITSNLLVQFYRNTPLAVGSSVGIAALAAIAVILLSRKKKLKSAA